MPFVARIGRGTAQVLSADTKQYGDAGPNASAAAPRALARLRPAHEGRAAFAEVVADRAMVDSRDLGQ